MAERARERNPLPRTVTPIGSGLPFWSFWAIVDAWFLMEGYYGLRRRRAEREAPVSRFERGSLGVVALALLGSLTLSFGLYVTGIGGTFPCWSVLLGLAISVPALALRAWSLATLGNLFSAQIRIRADHRIIRAGPYQWLRHPSYTGFLLIPTGAVVALGSELGALLTFAIGLGALGYRIRQEERMLVDRFGEEYREYARSSWRILPGLY